MRSFKRYQPTPSDLSEEETKTLNAAELTKKLAQAWNGKRSGEILAEILSEAEKSKKQGTLTNEDIDEFYKQFSSFLSPKEKRNLSSVTERLKKL